MFVVDDEKILETVEGAPGRSRSAFADGSDKLQVFFCLFFFSHFSLGIILTPLYNKAALMHGL